MMQIAYMSAKIGDIQIQLPSPDVNVMTGVKWGAVEAFPTAAYWVYQVLFRRLEGNMVEYKLGHSLTEEVGACLLGGYGIPASVGLAAYERLRTMGAFTTPPAEAELLNLLTEPLEVQGRKIRYRFAAQKARYLAAALPRVAEAPQTETGRVLRDWLIQLPGIGYKTASWIARNWLRADDVAILDIHILRAGRAIGLFADELTVEKDYLKLEGLFLEFSHRVGLRPSELDAVIWHEMAHSPMAVRQMTQRITRKENAPLRRSQSDQSETDTAELALSI
jgi:thermostable 8-oxoguanine DNA glycosylase